MLRNSVLTAAVLSVFVLAGCGDDDPADPGNGGNDDEIVFTYDPPAGVPAITTIHVAGTFNEWNATALPMVEQGNGTWRASIELAPGVYEFKYVFNGSQWASNMCDDAVWGDPADGGRVTPLATTCVDDEHGGMNAEITVD